MKYIVIVFLLLTLAGCGRQTPEYLSADDLVCKYYGHERYEDGNVRWDLLEVLGPDGPYILGTSAPMQSNPGQTVTFWTSNDGARIEKQYVPDSEKGFFLSVPVVNRDGLNAIIVLRTIEEEQENAS